MFDSYMGFNHFSNNIWYYDSIVSDSVMAKMSP